MADTTSLSHQPTSVDIDQIQCGQEVGRDKAMPSEAIERLQWIAGWMDSAFRIPGTSRKIGLDSIIGFIPGVGDTITGLVSAEFIRQAMIHGARKRTIAKMAINIGVDTLVGSIPLVGDLFDFAFKANAKNLRLLEREFDLTNQGQE